MRRLLLPIAALLTVAACTGDSGGDAVTLPDTTTTELPVQTVASTEAPPSTEAITTAETTTTTSTTTTSTTTTEGVPLTVLEPATTVIPADIDETFAEAFAVYQEAWLVKKETARAPDDEDLLGRIREYYGDPVLTTLLESFAEQATSGLVDVVSPDRVEPSVYFIEAFGTDEAGNLAQFRVCEVFTDRIVNVGTGETTYDDVVALTGDVVMNRLNGQWLVQNVVRTGAEFGTECS